MNQLSKHFLVFAIVAACKYEICLLVIDILRYLKHLDKKSMAHLLLEALACHGKAQ